MGMWYTSQEVCVHVSRVRILARDTTHMPTTRATRSGFLYAEWSFVSSAISLRTKKSVVDTSDQIRVFVRGVVVCTECDKSSSGKKYFSTRATRSGFLYTEWSCVSSATKFVGSVFNATTYSVYSTSTTRSQHIRATTADTLYRPSSESPVEIQSIHVVRNDE